MRAVCSRLFYFYIFLNSLHKTIQWDWYKYNIEETRLRILSVPIANCINCKCNEKLQFIIGITKKPWLKSYKLLFWKLAFKRKGGVTVTRDLEGKCNSLFIQRIMIMVSFVQCFCQKYRSLRLLKNRSIQIPNTDGLVKADRLFFANCCLGDSLPL